MSSINSSVDVIYKASGGWMLPAKNKTIVRRRSLRFTDHWRSYCENSSLNGLKYITEPGRHWIERVIWITANVAALVAAGYVVFGVYREYEKSPIVTTLETDSYPVNLIQFPGIAVCTINRISRKSASRMAEEIVNANVTGLSYEKVLDLLRLLGHLIDHSQSLSEKEQHEELHELLVNYYNGEYDVNVIMKNLAPKCSEIFAKCIFNGFVENCTEIFHLRKTQDGFCCIFNYARENDDFIPVDGYNGTGDKLRNAEMGLYNGLTMLIRPLLSDSFFSILPIDGWKLLLFHSEDYPDDPSGGVTETLISPMTEAFLRLNAISFHTPEHIIDYPIVKRNCLFHNEMQELYATYTYSDCIVNCRVDDIWKTCGCLPFFFPKREGRRSCNIKDLQCVKMYNSKRNAVFPNGVPDSGGSSEALYCKDCYPDCDDVRYFVQNLGSVNLHPGHYHSQLMSSEEIVDHSIVHLYFGKAGISRLKQDVIYYWYELLSNIGGICGVFVGFSFLSVVEVLFALLRPMLSKCERVERKVTHLSENSTSLYWKEFYPKGRKRSAPTG